MIRHTLWDSARKSQAETVHGDCYSRWGQHVPVRQTYELGASSSTTSAGSATTWLFLPFVGTTGASTGAANRFG